MIRLKSTSLRKKLFYILFIPISVLLCLCMFAMTYGQVYSLEKEEVEKFSILLKSFSQDFARLKVVENNQSARADIASRLDSFRNIEVVKVYDRHKAESVFFYQKEGVEVLPGDLNISRYKFLGDLMFFKSEIIWKDIYVGDLFLQVNASYLRERRGFLYRSLFWMFFGIVVLFFFITAILDKIIVSPIVKLTRDVVEIGKLGAYEKRVNEGQHDEIGVLSEQFNNMLQGIQIKNDILKDKEIRLSAVIDAAMEGVFTVDNFGIITMVNPAGSEIFGYSKNGLIGKSIDILSVGSSGHSFKKMINEYDDLSKRDFGGIRREITGKKESGALFFLEISLSRMMIFRRAIFLMTCRDISEEKAYGDKLKEDKKIAEQLVEAKTNLLANVSHEIRTPMNSVLGFADRLLGTDLDETQKKYLQMVVSSGRILIDIFDDILDHSIEESGDLSLEVVNFNVRSLIKDVFRMVNSRLEGKIIDIYMDVDENVPDSVEGDPKKFRQVLHNLLNNAIKFTAEGQIGILVSKDEALCSDDLLGLLFIVKDSGVGIPKSKQGIIFEDFSQQEEVSPRRAYGAGLGLFVCKSIVEAMGGSIWVESELDQGSEFKFTSVFKKFSKCNERDELYQRWKKLKDQRVFIIDDNEIVRQTLEQGCRTIGMKVVGTASSGQAALHKIEAMTLEDFPNIILCDIRMPGMDGYQFVQKIKSNKNYAEIKNLAVMANQEVEILQDADQNGFDGYLLKPVSIDDIVAAMVKVLSLSDGNSETISSDRSGVAQSCEGIKVLVVDDIEANQMLIEAFFVELKCEGDFVSNGKEAVERVKTDKYDLILMDMQMKVMNGIDATKIIRKEVNADIPIIALTANVLKKDKKTAEEAGMNDFLTKPISIGDLKKAIVKYGRK